MLSVCSISLRLELCVLKLFLQNLLSKFDEINASIEDMQLLCERDVMLADSAAVRQQVRYL